VPPLVGSIYSIDNILLGEVTLKSNIGRKTLFKLTPLPSSPAVAVGQNVVINIFDPVRGANTFDGEINEIDGNEIIVYKFHPRADPDDRRQDIKILVDHSATLIHTYFNPEVKAYYQKKLNVRIRDISAGGVCICSKTDININDKLELLFRENKRTTLLKIKILRKAPADNDELMYGCAFCDITPGQEHAIRRYIFKAELKGKMTETLFG
jgi:hypothetical protein